MFYSNLNFVESSLDLAAAWENVGEVKSAVSVIRAVLSVFILTGGRLGDCMWTNLPIKIKATVYIFDIQTANQWLKRCLLLFGKVVLHKNFI